ncbi:ABC transporter permease subunit [Aquabacterium sp.]|uniref:ABC transporter permease subunit n=1 Tax=Aquabacterium sp. TaxID=1872578 RepID=UPI0035B362FF
MLDFLSQPAGFDIGETGLMVYDASQPLWRALLVGLSNTLRVALPAIVAATVVGLLLALMRRSRHMGARSLATMVVELIRNVPLLLQLFIWYFLLVEWLPDTQDALQLLPGVWLSKGGLAFPWPELTVQGLHWHVPALDGFAIAGGAAVTPEYLALFVALVVYTAAFMSEIMRAGLEAVPHSLEEAAETLGATPSQILRKVVLPQALRTIVPGLTNQYLNLIKNSSLAVAIGYPDLVSVGNTTINQTGKAVDCIAVMMLLYLALSLATSAVMNWFNLRYAIRGQA